MKLWKLKKRFNECSKSIRTLNEDKDVIVNIAYLSMVGKGVNINKERIAIFQMSQAMSGLISTMSYKLIETYPIKRLK